MSAMTWSAINRPSSPPVWWLRRSTRTTASSIEVRKSPDGVYFLTTGNLFGSQTLRCVDADAAFRAIHAAAHASVKKPAKVPEGTELVT